MRYLVIAAALAAGIATAQDSFLAGDELDAEVKSNCAEGCVVFSHERMDNLVQAVRQIAAQAYALGKQEGSAGCRL